MRREDTKQKLIQALFVLYHVGVLALFMTLFPKTSSAGVIRKLNLTPEKPGTINLAFGNATAISFQSKPEKLVPGSPDKVQIDFLGKDITVSPLMPSPGNLIIYTRSGRYVLLFRITSEASHDDVVEISQGSPGASRRVRLDQDTYRLERVEIRYKSRRSKPKKGSESIQVLSQRDRIAGTELASTLGVLKRLRCNSCVYLAKNDCALICSGGLPSTITCQSDEYEEISLRRVIP